MARKNREEAGTETDTAEKVDGRYKKLKDPASGQIVNRVEYIRYLCKSTGEGGKGMTRSQAREEISRLTGENIRYQIIFAATKGMVVTPSDRGKKKEVEAEA